MPQLPRYQSQRSLTKELPEPLQQGAAERAAAFAPVIEAAAQINQKWGEAVDNMQETAVKLSYEQAQAQVEADSINDIDINGEDKQIKSLKKTSEEALKGITNAQLRDQLKFQLDHANGISAIKIKNIYAKKKILADNLNTEALLTQYARSGDPVNDDKAFSLIQRKVATGFYTPTQGENLLKDYRLGSVDFDIQSDPSTTQQSPVLQELLKGKSGQYGKLTDNELSDKIKDAKINIWRNKNSQVKQEKETHTQGALSLSQELVNQTLTSGVIQKKLMNKEIDAKTAAIFDNAVSNKKQYDGEDANKASVYLLDLIDDKTSALEVLGNAAEYRGIKGKGLDDKSYGFLIQEAAKKLEREKKGLSGWDKTMEVFKGRASALRDYASSMFSIPEMIAGKMVNKLLEKIQTGEDAEEAARQIQKDTVMEYHPAALTYPKEGKQVMDSLGNIKLILPDLTIKDIAQKPTKAE